MRVRLSDRVWLTGLSALIVGGAVLLLVLAAACAPAILLLAVAYRLVAGGCL